MVVRKPKTDAAPWTPLIEGIVALLHPHAEVVVHDVASDRIAAIWNPFSGRKIGDPSLLSELPDHDASGCVLGPYEKIGHDGHRMTSVSIPVADGALLICINLDRYLLDDAISALQRFARAVSPQPQALFERDWREEIHRVVDEWCRQEQLDRARLTRSQRISLVGALDHKGLFATRNAAGLVAKILEVSRATVYTLLREARQ